LRLDHHQSHESLQSENTKKKRKAPVVVGKREQIDKTEQQQDVTNSIIRPGRFSDLMFSFVKTFYFRFRASSTSFTNKYRFSINR